MILGIDLGASSADFVLFGKGKIIRKKSMPPVELEHLSSNTKSLGFPLEKVSLIALTGGKSAKAKRKYQGIPVKKVDEIQAIGFGGLFVSGKRKALVASLGTGTCIVNASGERFEHCSGTGVSGGTLLGLGKLLLGTADLKRINQLAAKGDLRKVDLQVKDIIGKGIGKLPGHATASNFAKQGRAGKSDIALGIINLVAETNAVAITLAAEKCSQHSIVLTGKLLAVPLLRKRLLAGLRLFGKKAIVPKHYGIATAIGACISGG